MKADFYHLTDEQQNHLHAIERASDMFRVSCSLYILFILLHRFWETLRVGVVSDEVAMRELLQLNDDIILQTYHAPYLRLFKKDSDVRFEDADFGAYNVSDLQHVEFWIDMKNICCNKGN
jgi:hypothetical protein